MAADPLSDVLSLLKPRSFMSGGVDAGGDWLFQFERSTCFLCLALVSGHCLLSMEDADEAVRLEAGDFVALPHGPAFRLASDLSVSPVNIRSVITEPLSGGIVSWQGGGACLGLIASFTFATEHANILMGLLPPLLHIRSHADRAVMQWYMERMIVVLRNPQPGGALLGEYLSQMMLIELLRLHVTQKCPERVGWLWVWQVPPRPAIQPQGASSDEAACRAAHPTAAATGRLAREWGMRFSCSRPANLGG